MADKKDTKLKDLKLELLKQSPKRKQIKKEIARLLTKRNKEDKKK
jgi:hypothetical protein